MKNIAGFYKQNGEQLTCAPTAVRGPDFELIKAEKDTYSYPVDGWTWFDTLKDACLSFGLDFDKFVDAPAASKRPFRFGN